MYLLQELLAKLIMGLQFYTDRECDDMKECVSLVGSKIFKQGGEIRSHFWLLYCCVLLGTSMMWCYYVEEPWVGWLKGRLESWEARGGGAAASTVRQQQPEEEVSLQSPSGRIQVTPLSKREPSPNKPLSQCWVTRGSRDGRRRERRTRRSMREAGAVGVGVGTMT